MIQSTAVRSGEGSFFSLSWQSTAEAAGRENIKPYGGNLGPEIKDFHDVIRLLGEHPEWQADLRRVILTNDLGSCNQSVHSMVKVGHDFPHN